MADLVLVPREPTQDERLAVAVAIERADNFRLIPENYAAAFDHPEVSDWNLFLADQAIAAMIASAPSQEGADPLDEVIALLEQSLQCHRGVIPRESFKARKIRYAKISEDEWLLSRIRSLKKRDGSEKM